MPTQTSFVDEELVLVLRWRKEDTVVDTGMGAGVVLEKAKGKVTVNASKRQAFKEEQEAVHFQKFLLETLVTWL